MCDRRLLRRPVRRVCLAYSDRSVDFKFLCPIKTFSPLKKIVPLSPGKAHLAESRLLLTSSTKKVTGEKFCLHATHFTKIRKLKNNQNHSNRRHHWECEGGEGHIAPPSWSFTAIWPPSEGPKCHGSRALVQNCCCHSERRKIVLFRDERKTNEGCLESCLWSKRLWGCSVVGFSSVPASVRRNFTPPPPPPTPPPHTHTHTHTHPPSTHPKQHHPSVTVRRW